MQYLVLCTCYHNLEHHTETGCTADDSRRCPCSLTKAGALDAAISAAANDVWRAPRDAALEG
jgi:hypothetical protein